MRSSPLVLIADDDEAMRNLLGASLRKRGFEVAEYRDGRELLQALQSNGDPALNANLIVSDLRMPGVTGLDVLYWLARQPRVVPMILITAFGDSQTHRRAKELGAAAVVDKPFDLREFHARVDEALNSA